MSIFLLGCQNIRRYIEITILASLKVLNDVFRKFRVESRLRNYLRNSRPELTNFLRNSRPEPKNGVSYKKRVFVSYWLIKISTTNHAGTARVSKWSFSARTVSLRVQHGLARK